MSQAPQKSGRGCVFYGCLTLLILAVLGSLGAYFGVRYAVKSLVNRFTDDHPASIPKATISETDWTSLQQRLAQFNQALESGSGGEDLVLTPLEINSLIARENGLAFLKDRVFVNLDGSEIKARLSMPLDELGLKGRYFNGSAGINLSLVDGVLSATLTAAEVKGMNIPAEFMEKLKKENLAKDAYKDPRNVEQIRKFQSIEVKDGRITIKARPRQPAAVER
ncbi:MAG: hypothetical protein FJ404_07405 [Verrucomicrobia bacterium]|nr:hypothetical protein [Verrucomicrobiota bacterium]